MSKMKLKITSDGGCMNTKLVDEEGREVKNVTSIVWECNLKDKQVATATIKLLDVPVEIEGEQVVETTVLGDEYGTYAYGMEKNKQREWEKKYDESKG